MQAFIEGVRIEHPIAAWMQLKNTQRVLNDKTAWNPGGWYERTRGGYTMCLANAARFVAHGSALIPMRFSRDVSERADIENVLMLVINKGRYHEYADIPEFNDKDGRTYETIKHVIAAAIKLVEPYAQAERTVIATDVLSKAEQTQMRKAVWAAEDAILREQKAKRDEQGRWRNGNGRFIRVPARIRLREYTREFEHWLDDHEQRGWDTFWDELAECDEHDKDCQQRRLELQRKQPAPAPTITEIVDGRIRSAV